MKFEVQTNEHGDRFYAVRCPIGAQFKHIFSGFQFNGDDGGEWILTTLVSYGQHGKGEILIILTGCDAENRVVRRGSIEFESVVDWINTEINSVYSDIWSQPDLLAAGV